MDDKLITVLTFTYPHELAIIRGRLESEGIECFVQDELTVQVSPFYSNAIGGIKLRVRESDYQKAVEILKAEGYITEPSQPAVSSKFVDDFNKFTSSIPFLGKFQIEIRLLIILAVLAAIAVIFAYFAMSPDASYPINRLQ